MAGREALLLETWRTLDETNKRHQFEQMLRYFVSPLTAIDEISPYQHSLGDYPFHSFQALIGGLNFIFVPGMAQWTTGLKRETARRMLRAVSPAMPAAHFVPQSSVSIPPMLVSQTPIPIDQVVKGQLRLATGQFYGDAFFQKRRQKELTTLLDQARRAQNKEQPLPKTHSLSVGTATLLPDTAGYQLTVPRLQTDYNTLISDLHRGGMALADRNAYLYWRTLVNASPYPWGEDALAKPDQVVIESYFGLDFLDMQTQAELLSGDEVAGAGNVMSTVSGQLDWSPYYKNGMQAQQILPDHLFYRPIIPITF